MIMGMEYIVEMLNITKSFPGIIANDDITLQLRKGEIHALLGENGAGKSTLMSVLFGLYQPEKGMIKKEGKEVKINNPNDANVLGIGMVHQHFKLVHNFTVLQNIILGVETTQSGFLKMGEARARVMALSKQYGLKVDPDALIEDITVGIQQRVEILKMLYRDNEILIFDEPTAVLTPQEIEELMKIMKDLTREGKSILFITHKLNEIKAVADRCTVLRKGKYIGTVDVQTTSKEELSETINTQPALFCVDLAAAAALKENGIIPKMVAGFSLGEIPALAFAGAFSKEEAFAFVCKRAQWMNECAVKNSGADQLPSPDLKNKLKNDLSAIRPAFVASGHGPCIKIM
jgi:simple sugar transport system ATP-binding protein